ncbi:MAG: hypothetical protein IVW54_01025 [Candidatus Binataceae bacterium]|nr:hypothetical protein [Candidatus Binataceae bacterium]
MKMIYLVAILAVVIAMGWAIHRYSNLAIFGPSCPPGSYVMAPSVPLTIPGLTLP